MFTAFTYTELLTVRKALTRLSNVEADAFNRAALLRKCNEELAHRAYPSVLKSTVTARQTP